MTDYLPALDALATALTAATETADHDTATRALSALRDDLATLRAKVEHDAIVRHTCETYGVTAEEADLFLVPGITPEQADRIGRDLRQRHAHGYAA